MKTVFLNAWDAKIPEIREYITDQAQTTDVFCFQEAYENMQNLCAELLPDYAAYNDYVSKDSFPQATYVHKRHNVVSSGSILKDQPNTGLGIYVEIEQSDNNSEDSRNNQNLVIGNFHGISRPGDKLDNPNRITQSQELIRFFNTFFENKSEVIIGGDFNLLPETESLKMFEQAGYTDLIKKLGITTTRNRYVWDRHPNSKQDYSDYVFISPSVELISFKVPRNLISDHLPLELETGSRQGSIKR